jgi:ribosomal protein S18 acetylase RimI-like enzyme
VSREAQGLGAGRTLVTAFLAEARRRGARKVDLTTDELDNEVWASTWRGRS